MTEPLLRVRDLTLAFKHGERENIVADRVSFDIKKGETLALVGESGSGKSMTALSILRLLPPAAQWREDSQILFGGRNLIDLPENELRRVRGAEISMVFQEPMTSLNPLHTIERQIAEVIEIHQGLSKAATRARVLELLTEVGIPEPETRLSSYPHQLSGGQRQRVAFARALVKHPKILLLDEPLAALDKKLRERAQFELVGLRARVGITFIMVTHDQEEAMSMASRIALMHHGKIVQTGSPRELYEAPASRYVADFFGAANLFAGKVVASKGKEVRVESAAAGAMLRGLGAARFSAGQPAAAMVRPEQVRLTREAPQADNVLHGRIVNMVFLGSHHVCQVMLASDKTMLAKLSPAELAAAGSLASGDGVYLSWPAAAARVLPE